MKKEKEWKQMKGRETFEILSTFKIVIISPANNVLFAVVPLFFYFLFVFLFLGFVTI